jgi:O-antigen/teichoic acid export membrane protein
VFTFFVFVRSAIQGLIDVGVVFVLQPRIVMARQSGDQRAYERLMLSLLAGVLGCAVALSGLAAVLIEPVLALIGRPEYAKELPAFWMVLGLTIVAALADVPQAGLYARHLDRAIVACALIGLAVAIAANLLLVPRFGIVGAAAATTCGFAAVGLGKTLALTRAR